MSDCIQAKKFFTVVTAVRKLCGFDEHTHRYENPHLAMKIGHSLNNCTNISLCEALMQGNKELQEETTAFETLYKKRWASEISSHPLEIIKQGKWNKSNTILSAEDIRKLNCFLKKETARKIKEAKKVWLKV